MRVVVSELGLQVRSSTKTLLIDSVALKETIAVQTVRRLDCGGGRRHCSFGAVRFTRTSQRCAIPRAACAVLYLVPVRAGWVLIGACNRGLQSDVAAASRLPSSFFPPVFRPRSASSSASCCRHGPANGPARQPPRCTVTAHMHSTQAHHTGTAPLGPTAPLMPTHRCSLVDENSVVEAGAGATISPTSDEGLTP